MLPYLKKTKEASVSVAPEHIKRESDSEEEFDGLSAVMEELCAASDKKDYKAMAEAFRAAMEICELEPHEEGPHIGEA